MNLDDYLRLQELDRIEGEKKCLVCLKKIINICLKRNYTFSIHALRDDSSINVTTDGWKSSYNAYFRGSLINYSDGKETLTVFELLEKLKNL